MSPSGKSHWNLKHGECTLESRAKHREVDSKLKLLELPAHKYMLID